MKWGVQSAFKTALEAVADGDVKMVWGADSHNGSPCLVNAINQMIHKDAGASPSQFASAVVSAFDVLNRELYQQIGEPNADQHYVTPFVAEILLRHFGAMSPKPADVEPEPVNVIDQPYVEKSDDEMAMEWLTASTTVEECKDVCPEPSPDVVAEVEAFLKG
jgi:hypothetical protein